MSALENLMAGVGLVIVWGSFRDLVRAAKPRPTLTNFDSNLERWRMTVGSQKRNLVPLNPEDKVKLEIMIASRGATAVARELGSSAITLHRALATGVVPAVKQRIEERLSKIVNSQ